MKDLLTTKLSAALGTEGEKKSTVSQHVASANINYLYLNNRTISEVCAYCGFMLIADCISACNSLNQCFY